MGGGGGRRGRRGWRGYWILPVLRPVVSTPTLCSPPITKKKPPEVSCKLEAKRAFVRGDMHRYLLLDLDRNGVREMLQARA